MKKIALYCTVAAFCLLFSCTSKTVTCDESALSFYTVGFAITDFYNSSLLTFSKNSKFDTRVDSAALPYGHENGDTFFIQHLNPDFDYKLVLPDAGIVYEITDIKFVGQTQQTVTQGIFDGKYYVCYNSVKSFNLNGTPHTVAEIDWHGPITNTYIHK